MDNLERMRRASAIRKEGEANSKENYKDASRERLTSIVEKKMRTTMIASLAKVEEHIGVKLWGHGLPASECTSEQLLMRKSWADCRDEILNKGNGQIRAFHKEILLYEVVWSRYNTDFRVV